MNKDDLLNNPFSICASKILYYMAFLIPFPHHKNKQEAGKGWGDSLQVVFRMAGAMFL